MAKTHTVILNVVEDNGEVDDIPYIFTVARDSTFAETRKLILDHYPDALFEGDDGYDEAFHKAVGEGYVPPEGC